MNVSIEGLLVVSVKSGCLYRKLSHHPMDTDIRLPFKAVISFALAYLILADPQRNS